MKNIWYVLVFIFLSGCNPAETALGDLTAPAQISDADTTLSGLISQNNLAALPVVTTETAALVALGESLFSDVNLSGNRDVSCLSCHNPAEGSVDRLPLSIGTGAVGVGSVRRQVAGVSVATNRNSPALFNLGRAGQLHAFFDGRVSFINGIVNTPVSALNGVSPLRGDITSVFKNVFEIQPLFPLISKGEMLGIGNDLASIPESDKIWDAILNTRILNQTRYVDLFTQAFPAVPPANLNPGHVGRAIGAFIKIKFKSANAPFDKYLAGDRTALTDSQKRGMILFYTRAQCVRCHSGASFSDGRFHTSGAPQISTSPFTDDTGLAAVSGLNQDFYRFKTPSLRNISLTAPYMHDGAFETLEAVVNHYSNIQQSLQNYRIPASYQPHYDSVLVKDTSAARNLSRLNQVDNRALRNGLNLTAQEQRFLVDFLRFGLRDPDFN